VTSLSLPMVLIVLNIAVFVKYSLPEMRIWLSAYRGSRQIAAYRNAGVL
jgi:hypothetical protein